MVTSIAHPVRGTLQKIGIGNVLLNHAVVTATLDRDFQLRFPEPWLALDSVACCLISARAAPNQAKAESSAVRIQYAVYSAIVAEKEVRTQFTAQ